MAIKFSNADLKRIGDNGQFIRFVELNPQWAGIAVDLILDDGTQDGCLIHVPGVSVESLT